MHLDNNQLMLLTLAALVVAMVYNQLKFRDKMLCTFIRPNKTKIEKWVPIYSKFIVFDRGKYGIGKYLCDPRCIVSQWYNRDLLTKLFPILIPTMEFRWDSPYPLNPEKFDVTMKTPEVIYAAQQESNQMGFSKGAAVQAGTKKRFPDWIWAVGALVIALAVMWYFNKGMQAQIQALANTIATKIK